MSQATQKGKRGTRSPTPWEARHHTLRLPRGRLQGPGVPSRGPGPCTRRGAVPCLSVTPNTPSGNAHTQGRCRTRVETIQWSPTGLRGWCLGGRQHHRLLSLHQLVLVVVISTGAIRPTWAIRRRRFPLT